MAGVLRVAMVLLLAGPAVAVAVAVTGSPWLPLVAAVLLGGSYGLALPSGLLQVQRLAAPGALARATAVYYSPTYAGFGLPLLFSVLNGWLGPAPIVTGIGGLALVSAAAVAGSKVVTDEFRRTPSS